jgi:hypothetical protein
MNINQAISIAENTGRIIDEIQTDRGVVSSYDIDGINVTIAYLYSGEFDYILVDDHTFITNTTPMSVELEVAFFNRISEFKESGAMV